jgi:hypothetical protein
MARHEDLVMTEVNDETLVYDQTSHAIHQLNPTSRTIWTLCDGTRTVPDVAQAAGLALGAQVSSDVVRLALGQLGSANLLVGPIPAERRTSRHSRRTMLRRMAIAGGVALPALVSISTPVAADHSSTCHELGTPCTNISDCCRGACPTGICCLDVGLPCTSGSQCCTGRCNSDNVCFRPAVIR